MTTQDSNLPIASPRNEIQPNGIVQRLSKNPLLGKNGSRAFSLSRYSANGRASSTISVDFTIHGDIKCDGTAKLDGEVLGNVECKELIVGENGRIIGDVNAETIVVYGQIEGSVHGNSVSLKSSATVLGNIFHNGLGIEMGARFLGQSLSAEVAGHDQGPETPNELRMKLSSP